MEVNVNELMRIIGSLYVETLLLKQQNAALQARVAELAKPEQTKDIAEE